MKDQDNLNSLSRGKASDFLQYVDSMGEDTHNPTPHSQVRVPTGAQKHTEIATENTDPDTLPRLVIETTEFQKRRIKAAAALAGVSIREFLLSSLIPDDYPLPNKSASKPARISIEVEQNVHRKIKKMALESGDTIRDMVSKKLEL